MNNLECQLSMRNYSNMDQATAVDRIIREVEEAEVMEVCCVFYSSISTEL